MDPTERFEALVNGPEPAIPLDELTLLVAAHAHPDLDVVASLRALDELAARCPSPTFTGVVEFMRDEGFIGNATDYYDERNSYLDDVLSRRTGIPITLSILMIEVARRRNVPAVGIGMPGRFLVRDALDTELFADPFAAQVLSRGECADVLAQSVDLPFDDAMLAPVGTRAIISRVLANLKAIHLARRDRHALAWVLRLRVLVPGVPLDERRELASALAADGRFLEAASVLDRLAEIGSATGQDQVVADAEQGATRLRARLN